MSSWPFESTEELNQLSNVTVDGFDSAIPGIVYDGHMLDGGVPLGGLGTGYFTLEGSGKIGFVSIYNDIVPPRQDFREWLTVEHDGRSIPLSSGNIAYFGHFPVADLRTKFPQSPIELGIRAFSPFILGDSAASNVPVALFEIEFWNSSDEDSEVRVTISPPRPPVGQKDAIAVLGHLVGVETIPLFDGATDEHAEVSSGPIVIHSGSRQRVRIGIGWYLPDWRDSSREPHVHRYGQRFESADQVVRTALEAFEDTLKKIHAWQNEIYASNYPAWTRDWLVQSLYSLSKNTVWIARMRKDEWWDDNGWFTHNESHTGCPITETMVCRMHGHFPTLFFFPELEQSTLEAFRHFQLRDGEVPFSYGMLTSMRDPRYHCQHPLNSGQYAQMILRQYLRTADRAQLEAFYDSAKSAILYQFTLDDDDDSLVNDQAHLKPGEHWPANQFYDVWPWWGTSAYVAGTWLASLAAAIRLADEVGDAEFGHTLRDTYKRGLESYEEKLWNGEYYRLWNDPENERLSEVSLANQLMAQWCVRVAGLPDVLQKDRIRSALRAVERLNVSATPYGLVNGVTPDGQRFDAGHRSEGYEENDHAKQTFVGEGLCAAMTQMYHGRSELGEMIGKRLYEAVMVVSRSPWNQRCLFDSETGFPVWGDDYYSNMVVWALPMALAGVGIEEICAPEELVSRILAHGAPRDL